MDILNLHIHKLSHDLEEIRIRSLNNIFNKLDMGLVTEEELIENPDFVKNILNWFTFSQVPKKDVVLKLILRITKIDRGKALIIRYDPKLDILREATKDDSKELFEEILLNCRSLVRCSSPTDMSSSLELSVPSRKADLDSVWILWRWLPEVELAESDSRLVSSLHSSLLLADQFQHSAHFFSSIMIHDFPPQLFLQRPEIINVFIDVIQSRKMEAGVAVECLELFTYGLIKQIKFCSNIHTTPLFSNRVKVGCMELSVSTVSSSTNSYRSIEESSLDICKKDKNQCSEGSMELIEFCMLVMEAIVRSENYREANLIRAVLKLLTMITTDQKIPWHQSPVHRCSNMLAMLAAAAHRSQVMEALDKLELNILMWELLRKLVPTDVADIALNKQLQDSLYQCILDPVLSHIFPQIHNLFSTYLDKCKYTPSAMHRVLSRVGESIKAGAKFLLTFEKLSMKECNDLFSNVIEGIEYHQNYSIILHFLQTCVRRSSEVIDCIDEAITRSVLRLLSSSDPCVVKTTLHELYSCAKAILGPMESSKTIVDVQPLLPILINHKILIEIISYCLNSPNNKELVVLSEDILILIIKSRRLINESNWSLILRELIPTFPYLQAFGGRLSTVGKEILNLFDPDSALKFQLTPIELLLGNLRFLVSKDAGARDESVSRLMYLVDIPSKPLNLIIPHDPIVPKKNLNDIYEASSMVRVLDLLQEPELDNRVIKSALIQLSVMTEDILLHDIFKQHSGVDIVLNYLSTKNKELYEEVFGPAITILKNLVRTNGKMRHDFSLKLDILKNAVRGLFMFDLDWRMQRDVSQFLVLMAYSSVIRTSADNVSFPLVILERIRDPFPPASHAESSQYFMPSYRDELLNDGARRNIISLQWALGCYDDKLEDLLRNAQLVGKSTSGHKVQSSDKSNLNLYPTLLPVPKSSLLDMAACHPYSNITAALEKLATATSHKRALDGLESLSRYLSFVKVAEPVDLSLLPWEEAFTRYLSTPPSSTTDQLLLLRIIKFFNSPYCQLNDNVNWLTNLFQEPSSVLIYLLKQTACDECTSLKKELCMEVLNLLKQCINKGSKKGWTAVFTLLIDSLNERHSLGFYCLGVIERLVGCLAEASKAGISSPSGISTLYQLLPAFQPSSPTSYMGLGITLRTLTSMNLCLTQKSIEDYVKDWDLGCIADRLASHDVLVRATTLQFLSSLCTTSSSTCQVLASTKDLWSSCLTLLLDHNEVNIVREQAAILCANILYHQESMIQAYVEEAENRGLYRVIAVICSKLSDSLTIPFNSIGMIQSSLQFLGSFSSTNSDEDDTKSLDIMEHKLMMTTSRLLEASCRLVINLSSTSKDMVDSLRTQGLSPALFRFLSLWCTKDTVIEEEKVQLYTKICKLLSVCPEHAGKLVNDSICNLVWILQPSSFDVQQLDGKKLESLWIEAIKLLGLLLSTYPDAKVYMTNECLKTIVNAASSHNTELELVTLSCIPSIAPSLNSKGSESLVEKLISMWNKSNLKESTKRDVRLALSSLLGNSHAATMAALKHGLAESLILKLRETYVTLSILPPDIPRQKKCNAVLAGLSIDIALVANLLAGNQEAKDAAASLGLADSLHKLWNWCLLDFSLISSILEALITLSASSIQGALSLVLTSTVVGVGQRKSPTSSSVLHAALELLSMPVYPAEIKKKVLQLACHACQSQECRVILSKIYFMKDFLKFNTEKKNNYSAELELAWLNFFCVLSSYNEGSSLIKDQELLNYLINSVSRNRKDMVKASLSIIRNLAFYPQSRQKLLMSDNLLNCLSNKLLDDSISLEEEKMDVILFVWALSANSQKSKQILRNFGFLERIQLQSALSPEYTTISSVVNTTVSVLKS